MRKIKTYLCLAVFIILVNMIMPVYADDELEETSITQEEIEEILEATTEVNDIPIINSRNAVIFDRTSRSSNIWERGKYKM